MNRDFYICSDCNHFEFDQLIDPRYELKRGFCNKHKKYVTDTWETECEDCTASKICKQCKNFQSYNDLKENNRKLFTQLFYKLDMDTPITNCLIDNSHPYYNNKACQKFEEK